MARSGHQIVRLTAISLTVLGLTSVGLAGCGGGSGEASGTAESTTAEAVEGQGGNAGEAEAGGSKQQGQRNGSHFRGGEKDIEEFGSEASGSEQEAVLSAEQTYLSSIVSRNYGKACTLVSKALDAQFSAIVQGGSGHKTCDQVLPRILAGDASHVAAIQLSGKIVKVRVQGDRGYVVFHAPGARLFVFPMVREGGGWHVGAITSSILAPSAATLGE